MYLNFSLCLLLFLCIFFVFNLKFQTVHYVKQTSFLNVSGHNIKIEGLCRMANINSARMKKYYVTLLTSSYCLSCPILIHTFGLKIDYQIFLCFFLSNSGLGEILAILNLQLNGIYNYTADPGTSQSLHCCELIL